MSEQNLPDEELTLIGEEPVIPDEGVDAVPPEQLQSERAVPDDYPGAAEQNPDRWQEDPLIQDDTVSGEEEDFLSEPALSDQPDSGRPGSGQSDQALRDETERARFEAGDEQVPPEEPTIGQAAADVDFGDTVSADELDSSDDPSHRGGDPLAKFRPQQR